MSGYRSLCLNQASLDTGGGKDTNEIIGQEPDCRDLTLAAMRRMSGAVAHDYNNFLSAIQGYAQLALIDVPGPEHPITESLQAIVEVCRQARCHSEKLSTVAGRRLPRSTVSTFLEVSESQVRRWVTQQYPDLRIKWEVPETLASIELPGSILEEALKESITNAIESGAGEVTVGGSLRGDEEGVEIIVSDDGAGMDGRTLLRCKEPYFSLTKKGRGVGLGLAKIDALVRGVGGELNIDSSLGEGTVVRFYFPLAYKRTLGNEVIWLLGDKLHTDAVGDFLEKHGYLVVQVDTVKEATSLLAQGKIGVDVIVVWREEENVFDGMPVIAVPREYWEAETAECGSFLCSSIRSMLDGS